MGVAGVTLALMAPAVMLGQDPEPLSLSQAVERGLSRYPSIGAARAETEAARATLDRASSAWFPAISLDASITRFSDAMVVYPLHELDIQRVPPFDETLTRAGTTLSYTLFDGFQRGAGIRRARADLGVAEAHEGGARQDLIAHIASTYLDILGLREVLDAGDDRIAALEAELSRVERLFGVGRAARLEVVRVEAELATARADRVAVAGALDVAERMLARLIDEPVEQARSDRLLPVSLHEAAVPIDPSRLADRVVDRNSAVERARRQQDAAAAAVSLARSSWWPRLDLTGNLIDYGSPNTDNQLEWSIGLAARWPLFTGLSRSHDVARAVARRRAAAEAVRLAEIEARQAVERTHSAVLEAAARVASLRAALVSLEEVAHIERLRLDAGTGVQTDFLRAQAELLATRASLAETRHREMMAHVELARVLGELTPAWLSENLEIDP